MKARVTLHIQVEVEIDETETDLDIERRVWHEVRHSVRPLLMNSEVYRMETPAQAATRGFMGVNPK